jgi:primosomal protein N' (replication factor Y) (superfamily II helicase)
MPFAHVAFALPLHRTFAYAVPEPMSGVRPGAQVLAPFRGRARRGFVVALAAETSLERVEPLSQVLDEDAISPHLLELARWIADYYVAPLGEVLSAALPGGLEGFAASRARRRAKEDPITRLALPERVTLTPEQRQASAAVEDALARGTFEPLLLHGVTASGKTEVYLRAADRARAAGGQTLVLVPEVALSSQVVALFRRRFGGRVGILHSYLSVGERRRNWELARRGALDVVVGARSAVFAPLPALALIVVDEEHEGAYKQSEMLRYHGRDVAVRRAQMLGIPVVLGSATPSLESLANASRGKYREVRLRHRVDRRPMPEVKLVDLRAESGGSGLLSRPLLAALGDRLQRGEQALLFLNRRGHSHYTQCRACGWVPQCPDCDITLTLHARPHAWRCHYCDHAEPFRAECPTCGATLLRFGSAGTQRIERELRTSLPKARVLRLDLDSARGSESRGDTLDSFARGEADVLLGTQMIAKGLDFPRVTLVGVLDADVSLHLPDFRAAERTYQLLVQVAGRSGRGRQAGEVLIQTCTPEHAAVAAASRHDERAFLDHELRERRDAGYPPFRRLVALRFAGKDAARVERAAMSCAEALDPAVEKHGVERLGPAPQPIARLRGQHRWHVLLKGSTSGPLHTLAHAARTAHDSSEHAHSVRMIVDVDPVEVM